MEAAVLAAIAPIELSIVPYRPGPSPAPYIAIMVLGFVIGVIGHVVRSRWAVGIGVAMIFVATVLLPLEHAGEFL